MTNEQKDVIIKEDNILNYEISQNSFYRYSGTDPLEDAILLNK